VPLTTEQFAILLETLLTLIKQGKRFTHKELYELYCRIINESKKLASFSDWAIFIHRTVEEWQHRMVAT